MSTYTESKDFIALPFLMHFQETDPNPSLVTGMYDPKLQIWVAGPNAARLNNSSTTRSTNTMNATATADGGMDWGNDNDTEND